MGTGFRDRGERFADMIRSPLGLRLSLNPEQSPRDEIRKAAALGAKGIVVDAAGDLAPDRLSDTGRRELRHLLRSTELSLIALNLPTRRPFDSFDGLDDRLARAERAMTLAYEIGSRFVLARVGPVPSEGDPKREPFVHALNELGRRAEHRGVRLAIETGTDAGETVRSLLEALGSPGLAASLDPAALLKFGFDPIVATRALGPWIVHAYANDATGAAGRTLTANPRGFGFPAGALDWEEYLGSLEEVEYRGFLTIFPEPGTDPRATFKAIADRLARF
jgi:sugar phosphate isomerase/epimerase